MEARAQSDELTRLTETLASQPDLALALVNQNVLTPFLYPTAE
jgi:hypothetical protein